MECASELLRGEVVGRLRGSTETLMSSIGESCGSGPEDELGCSSDGDPVSRSAITKHPGGCTYHDCAGLLNDLINRTC